MQSREHNPGGQFCFLLVFMQNEPQFSSISIALKGAKNREEFLFTMSLLVAKEFSYRVFCKCTVFTDYLHP